MIKKSKISYFSGKCPSNKLKASQGIADQCLNNIRLLQVQLNREKLKLTQLLQTYGPEVVPYPKEDWQ